MATKKQDRKEEPIEIVEINTGEIEIYVVGKTPLICNRLSEKARRELLLPKGRKNAAEKASTLKHDPLGEFRASPYTLKEETAPTLIALPGSAFKSAGRDAALRMPGGNKTEMGQLTWVTEWNVPIYGIPQIFSTIVRSADQNRTPDVRTRAILPEWCAVLHYTFVKPMLRETAVVNLLAAGGIICGVGDFRQQKGSGNFGQFRIVAADDADYRRIAKEGGRAAQRAAMDDPTAYDEETEELLSWYDAEAKRRGFKVAA